METFNVTVENLGPIRSARFAASHFNILCGKNNSGKSMCIHTVFCFLSKWRGRIHLSEGDNLANELVQKTRVKIEALSFVEKINPVLESSSKDFSAHLYEYLNRSPGQLRDCEVIFQMNPDYIRNRLECCSINVFLSITPTSKMILRKAPHSTEASFSIENSGGGEFPEMGLVKRAANRLLDYLLIESVLPRPYLMTAERSGSILYGDDLRTRAFLERGAQSEKIGNPSEDERYAYPYVEELHCIWMAQSNLPVKPSEPGKTSLPDDVRRVFDRTVALGAYNGHDGKIYYQPSDEAREFRLNEVSTSVRALMQLNDFVNRSMREQNLLLMMDEPELNLHPERQRALARFLVLLMKHRGVGVVLSTHSDYIVKEINTLLMFGSQEPAVKDVMREHCYQEDEFLNLGDVACGITENHTITPVRPDASDGLILPVFDSTIEEMNVIQDEIRWRA